MNNIIISELEERLKALTTTEQNLRLEYNNYMIENKQLNDRNSELTTVLTNLREKYTYTNHMDSNNISIISQISFSFLPIIDKQDSSLSSSVLKKKSDLQLNNKFDKVKATTDLKLEFIDYSKDNLLLKRKIITQEDKLLRLERVTKIWIDSIEQLKKSTESTIERLSLSSDNLLIDLEIFEECPDTLQILYGLNNLLSDISSQMRILTTTMENSFIFPLKSLFSTNFRSLGEFKQLMNKHFDDFTLITTKFLSTKKSHTKDILRDNYFNCKKLYELSKFDYIVKLNELSIIMKVDLPEKLCLLIIVLNNSVSYTYDFIEKLKPTIGWNMEKIMFKQSHVAEIKNDFKSQKQELLDKGKLVRDVDNNDKIRKEGFLNIKLIGSGDGFKKRYVKIINGCIIYHKIKNDQLEEKQNILTKLLLCNVKFNEKDYDYYFCFEVMNAPEKKTYLLQSDSESDAEDWFLTIRNAISSTISSYKDDTGNAKSPNKKDILISSNNLNTSNQSNSKSKRIENLISKSKCADCNADNPTWISHNWIVLVCIDCSGIHRSLGNSISKIKSLRLDNIEDYTIDILEYCEGHDKFNNILEANLKNKEKLKKTSNTKEKEAYITDKYKNKLFFDKQIYQNKENEFILYIDKEEILKIYVIVKQDESFLSKSISGYSVLNYCLKANKQIVVKLLMCLGCEI